MDKRLISRSRQRTWVGFLGSAFGPEEEARVGRFEGSNAEAAREVNERAAPRLACRHLVEAPSREVVADLTVRAQLRFERVSEVA